VAPGVELGGALDGGVVGVAPVLGEPVMPPGVELVMPPGVEPVVSLGVAVAPLVMPVELLAPAAGAPVSLEAAGPLMPLLAIDEPGAIARLWCEPPT
jgi:hypothetical protein